VGEYILQRMLADEKVTLLTVATAVAVYRERTAHPVADMQKAVAHIVMDGPVIGEHPEDEAMDRVMDRYRENDDV